MEQLFAFVSPEMIQLVIRRPNSLKMVKEPEEDTAAYDKSYLCMCLLTALLNCIDKFMISSQSNVTDLADLYSRGIFSI